MDRSDRQELYIENAGKKIYVCARYPAAQHPSPAVIFSHGFNGSAGDFASEADFLAANGIVSYCLDFCGGSIRSRSSLKTTEMTVFTEQDDLLAVIRHAKTDSRTDGKNIFLFGGSQGGLVSALAAERLQNEIRGLILLYPAMCIPDDWRKIFPKTEDIPETYTLWGMPLGRNYFMSLRSFCIFENIGAYPGQVLILHGEADSVVPLCYGKKTAAAYKHARFTSFPGEGHGFSSNTERKVCAELLNFIRQNLV